MNNAIYFDMDGTLADLYGVENWLQKLQNSDSSPYELAKPLINLSVFARLVNQLQRKGYTIGIVSWLSKNSTKDYDIKVTASKLKWLKQHLKSVSFDEIHIVDYGTPKHLIVKYSNGYLVDDEIQNLSNWTGTSIHANDIINFLKSLGK